MLVTLSLWTRPRSYSQVQIGVTDASLKVTDVTRTEANLESWGIITCKNPLSIGTTAFICRRVIKFSFKGQVFISSNFAVFLIYKALVLKFLSLLPDEGRVNLAETSGFLTFIFYIFEHIHRHKISQSITFYFVL